MRCGKSGISQDIFVQCANSKLQRESKLSQNTIVLLRAGGTTQNILNAFSGDDEGSGGGNPVGDQTQ